ncbi:MAG TPA: amidohydrolase family protein [Acidobacteriota bacterium]
MTTETKRIDVHHHILPPEYMANLAQRNIDWTSTGHPPPAWNPSMARELMERYNISAAITSVCAELFWNDDIESAVKWGRHCNEYMARLVQDDPIHFGGFATLPLPNTEAAIKEAVYALDVLKLDGVLLFSSSDGYYPGDPRFEELFQELNRRSAIVFVHPNTVPPGSNVPKLNYPFGIIEFLFDTTRCITNLLFSGTLERYPNIRYIFSHSGGTVPYIAWRIANSPKVVAGNLEKNVPKGPMYYLQRLYYDTALSTSEFALAALRQFVPTSQILFGSDYPMVPEIAVKMEVADYEASKVLDDSTRNAIDRQNALALFPRFSR